MPVESESQTQEASWAQLMRGAQVGDSVSYERLLREIMPFIRSLASRYCRDPQVAEDVVQDVLLTVHRVRHTWDPRRPFSPWLAAIAARRGIDRIRRDSRIARHEVRDDQALESFATAGSNQEGSLIGSLELIEPLLAALPERQRKALEAVKIKGLSMSKASVEVGQTVATLRVTLHRAVKSLRKLVHTNSRNPDD
jgi:RNA polymerase sigma-70 factor (ECF subfamily)